MKLFTSTKSNSSQYRTVFTGDRVGDARFRTFLLFMVLAIAWIIPLQSANASEFVRPWKNNNTALVLDAYELNALDWNEIVKNKRIVGFIGKASDGLSAIYCTEPGTICSEKWRRYSVTRELYHTRKMLAKALGLKWGTYHLGRRGNPEQQALHFIQFADPQPDEAIILDIETLDGNKFITLEEAERFAKYIYSKLDRYPMLYTNNATAEAIAANRKEYPILSRMKLWYARYKDNVASHFPMGNWDSYTLWQFSYGGNCNKSSCPYRVKGTPNDIDVNVAVGTPEAVRAAWPFDGLVKEKPFETEPDAETIYVSNTVEDPEAEKHSDFIGGSDYVATEHSKNSTVIALEIKDDKTTDMEVTAETAGKKQLDNGFCGPKDEFASLETC